jgi:hypothetical protein
MLVYLPLGLVSSYMASTNRWRYMCQDYVGWVVFQNYGLMTLTTYCTINGPILILSYILMYKRICHFIQYIMGSIFIISFICGMVLYFISKNLSKYTQDCNDYVYITYSWSLSLMVHSFVMPILIQELKIFERFTIRDAVELMPYQN